MDLENLTSPRSADMSGLQYSTAVDQSALYLFVHSRLVIITSMLVALLELVFRVKINEV